MEDVTIHDKLPDGTWRCEGLTHVNGVLCGQFSPIGDGQWVYVRVKFNVTSENHSGNSLTIN
jgi:hypothetical protein